MTYPADGPDRARLGELFEEVLALPPEARNAFLERVCTNEPALLGELRSLLEAHARAPNRLEKMAGEVVPAAFEAVSLLAFPTGQVVSHYQIEAVVGAGGMGVVYKARDLALGRTVALKFLRPHLTGDPAARRRLESEARAACAFDHPHIAAVYEIGSVRSASVDELFVAMAFCTGETLRQKIARGPLPIRDALRYAAQVADGLACAHDAGIVHRDVKPANVIVSDRGEAKVLDFGIARSGGAEPTRESALLGSIAYMSPEQTRGERVDHRTDIWSVGALLYEMLTGRRPFPGDDDTVVIHAIRRDEPQPVRSLRPDVPDAVVHVIRKCLAKDAGDRYQRTPDLVAALKAIELGATSGPGYVHRSRVSRKAVAAIAGSLLVLAVATAVRVQPGALGRGALRADPASANASSPMVAILPFTPTVADAELERLGRDLVVTLSSGLDGMGALRAVDAGTTLAAVPTAGVGSLEEARDLARQLGADRFITGALLRTGPRVRLDLSMYKTGDAGAMVRTSVTDADPASLSDAATIALLDDLWQHEPPPVPSLAAVRRTRIPDARRAYIQGEIAMARLDMAAAVAAFERAFAADPTFWWAYWRSLYPRSYREADVPADPALVQMVFEHRSELPEPDRLLIEAWNTASRVDRSRRLADLTTRFPTFSPGWWAYADFLVHVGPYLGHTPEDARATLEQFLLLSPDFAPGWRHLSSVAVRQLDAATAQRTADRAGQLAAEVGVRPDLNAVQRLRAALSRSGSFSDDLLSQAVELGLSGNHAFTTTVAGAAVADGSPAAQLQLNPAIRARGVTRGLDAALWRGEALAWAARGEWDEALTAAERWSSLSSDANGVLGAYRLAIAGVLVGGIASDDAGSRRPVDPAAARWSVDERAEFAWLDGLLAYLDEDRRRLRGSRRTLSSARDAAYGALLERSLAAFDTDLAGERERASRDLRDLELHIADAQPLLRIEDRHPLLIVANRLLVGRWLRALGDDLEAARFLTWHEAMPIRALPQAWNMAIGGMAWLERAEIAEAAGDTTRARLYYSRFLRQYDRPVPRLTPLVSRASAGLHRVAPGATASR